MASHFERVCKMRPSTGCESLVKQRLYTVVDCEAMQYGRTNEESIPRKGKRGKC